MGTTLARPLVYLDTQDYSRLADALDGRFDSSWVDVYEELIDIQRSGEATFVYSGVVLSELLQYTRETRELALRKAMVVESLCRGACFKFPSRLLAIELLSSDAARSCLPVRTQIEEVISSSNMWMPSFESVLGGVREKARAGIDSALSDHEFLNRRERRKAKSAAKRIDLAAMARAAAPEIMSQIPLSEDYVLNVFPAILAGKISDEEASRRLVEEMALPTRFVKLFLERSDKAADFPDLIAQLGRRLKASVVEIREKIRPLYAYPDAGRLHKETVQGLSPSVAKTIFTWAGSGEPDERLKSIVENLREQTAILADCPTYKALLQILPAYLIDNTRIGDSERMASRGDGGDLMHFLYINHSDIWRSDTYFSSLVKRAKAEGKALVVDRLKVLPDAIRSWRKSLSS